MTTRQGLLVGLALTVAALLYTAVLYPALPAQIPVHWNLHGQVDGWADKQWAAWLMPGIMLLIVGMTVALPAISPRGFQIAGFLPTFNYVMALCTALMGYIQVMMLQAALHPAADMGRWLVGGVFLFIALVGNVMGKTRRNFWMGYRTPWTLASDSVWIATHRLAGRLMVAVGLVGAVAILLGAPIAPYFVILMVAMLIPAVYSFVLFKRE